MGRIPHTLALATLTAALAAAGAAQAQSQATPATNTEVPTTGQDTNRAPGNSGTQGAGSLNMTQRQGAWVNGVWVNDPGTPSTGQDTNRYPGNSGPSYQGKTARDVMPRNDLHTPVNPPPGMSRSDDEENR